MSDVRVRHLFLIQIFIEDGIAGMRDRNIVRFCFSNKKSDCVLPEVAPDGRRPLFAPSKLRDFAATL